MTTEQDLDEAIELMRAHNANLTTANTALREAIGDMKATHADVLRWSRLLKIGTLAVLLAFVAQVVMVVVLL